MKNSQLQSDIKTPKYKIYFLVAIFVIAIIFQIIQVFTKSFTAQLPISWGMEQVIVYENDKVVLEDIRQRHQLLRIKKNQYVKLKDKEFIDIDFNQDLGLRVVGPGLVKFLGGHRKNFLTEFQYSLFIDGDWLLYSNKELSKSKTLQIQYQPHNSSNNYLLEFDKSKPRVLAIADSIAVVGQVNINSHKVENQLYSLSSSKNIAAVKFPTSLPHHALPLMLLKYRTTRHHPGGGFLKPTDNELYLFDFNKWQK